MDKIQIEQLCDRVLHVGDISAAEALALAGVADKEALYGAADRIRRHFAGEAIDMCSIMNAQSGRCTEDCKWCAQSKHFQTGVAEYGFVNQDEAVQLALENSRQGVNRFSLVTSGRALSRGNVQKACAIYREIGQRSDIHLCASMGLLRGEELKALHEAGVTHYHCNIETAPSLFATLCTTHTLDEKARTIAEARAAGLKICSGGIIGMGESMGQRIEMALKLREWGVDSIPLNILTPIEGTPLYGKSPLTDEEVLTTIALFRFINPRAQIRFAGGRHLIAHIQEQALRCGISAALVGDYLTTIGSNIEQDKQLFARVRDTHEQPEREKAP
ncbi:biotin synthase [Breznakibacter xylanolyticus]|uniref:Biotin synthase n=1 Tax=Breznakibacter xylanolyticus TaxID=990 RepID=A0A2W7Q8G5_9BACT|nr:biotin synthase BioB [Breznakibacter xylanolyticus]PZX18039.1 biotin synthase [Breznakibacter xylanolyticus]